MEVGDGKSIHFWFDNWMGNGRLIDIAGAVGTTYLGVRRHPMVSEAVVHGDWSIRGKRSRRFHHLYESILAKEAPSNNKGGDIRMGHNGMDPILDKLLFQTVVYQLWRERNGRCHHQAWTNSDQLRRLIDKAMRNRIFSLKYHHPHKLAGLLQCWLQLNP
ncbi:hypothetical protein F2Q68_00007713 [Brassica cretica]|uniref:Reverse transcriptase zinc-binding domain-containing protein n=1 Tax=Brassica cretica TaxID=69181 RepID=A0A8S9KLP9_BRACR|nr:hypothetical protein F2Q68_00007713 [Brassica cretica]